MLVSKKCPQCGKEWSVVCDPLEYKKYLTGKYLIQDCFPNMEPSDREIFITGICEECFNKLFEEDE